MKTILNPDAGCRGCKKSPALSEIEIEQLVHEQLQLETDFVNDSTYQNRMKNCESCPSLVARTCVHCGCYVQFRARLANKHCPYPQGAKW